MLMVGLDVIELARVQRAVQRWGERFLCRVYTTEELRFCRGRIPELAARFAAKEAVMKALGTGRRGVGWQEIEVLPNKQGRPLVRLSGGAWDRAQELGVAELVVSLTHGREVALASVVGNAS